MLEYFLVFSCNGIDVIFYIYVILEEYKEMLQYSSLLILCAFSVLLCPILCYQFFFFGFSRGTVFVVWRSIFFMFGFFVNIY